MDRYIQYIGYTAAFLTTFSFLPQAVKIIRTRDTGGISVWMYLAFTIGVFLWFVYGIAKNDPPLIAANGVTLLFATVILFFTVKYRKR